MNSKTPEHHSYFTNIIILSVCFFGIFFAFNSSQALQTTANKTQGYINLGCLYGVFSLFSIFGPKVVAIIGPKISIILGGITYALVVISNFNRKPIVQVCANLLVGVGAALLWNAQGVYLGRCAVWDSRTSTKSFAETTSSFNGVFYAIFQFCGFAGTLISGMIKQLWPNNTNLLFGLLSVVGSVSVLFLAFLPNVKPYTAAGQVEENKDDVSLVETFSLLGKSLKLVMLLPLIFYNGMSLAYIFGDLTSGVSEQFFGGAWVMYNTAIFYGVNAFFTYLFGKCIEKKWMSRSTMCLIAFVCQVVYFIFIIFCRIPKLTTDKYDIVMVIIMLMYLSAGDAVWESQLTAILQSFYGTDRERNASMANYKMWQSLGFCAQFVIGVFLPDPRYIPIKSIVLLVLLVIGYVCLVILDKKYTKLDMKKGESAALLGGVSSQPLVKPYSA